MCNTIAYILLALCLALLTIAPDYTAFGSQRPGGSRARCTLRSSGEGRCQADLGHECRRKRVPGVGHRHLLHSDRQGLRSATYGQLEALSMPAGGHRGIQKALFAPPRGLKMGLNPLLEDRNSCKPLQIP